MEDEASTAASMIIPVPSMSSCMMGMRKNLRAFSEYIESIRLFYVFQVYATQ